MQTVINKPENFASYVYHDRSFNCETAKILPGEYYYTGNDMMIVTVLGSCVSACLIDPVARTILVAAVWRRSWNRKSSMPAAVSKAGTNDQVCAI